MSRIVIPPILKNVKQNIPFDFSSLLAIGETISTQVVTATVYSGTDAAPSNIISGSATASSGIVTQLIDTTSTNGVAGVTYELLAAVTTSAGQTLHLSGYLTITLDLP